MQQVKVGGTTYSIIRGKTKIDGTGYTIFGGKTKVGGTAYAIDLAPVPPDYRRVKWIEATQKGPYVVLPFTSQIGLKATFEMAFSNDFLTNTGSRYYNVWGFFGNSGTRLDQIFNAYKASGSTRKPRIVFRSGSSSTDARISDIDVVADTLYEVEVSSSSTGASLTFNGETVTATDLGLAYVDKEMRLFTTQYFGSTSNYYPGPGRFGRFLAYDSNNTLLCDLWPCYRQSDGEPGFWDSVSKTFLSNSGTGSLIAGPTVIS